MLFNVVSAKLILKNSLLFGILNIVKNDLGYETKIFIKMNIKSTNCNTAI